MGADDATLTRYLLGKLSPEEETALEAQYLADPALQDRLGEAEDALVDAYLEDELAAEDREALAGRFLASPRGARKLAVARALGQVAAAPGGGGEGKAGGAALPPRRWRRIAGVAGGVAAAGLAAAALLWLGVDEGARGPGAPVAISLQPGATRGAGGGGRPTLTLPRGASGAAVQLLLEADNHPVYHVALLGAEEQPRWQQGGLHSVPAGPAGPGRALLVALPAEVLEPGEHTLLVSAGPAGTTPVGAYSFLVRRD